MRLGSVHPQGIQQFQQVIAIQAQPPTVVSMSGISSKACSSRCLTAAYCSGSLSVRSRSASHDATAAGGRNTLTAKTSLRSVVTSKMYSTEGRLGVVRQRLALADEVVLIHEAGLRGVGLERGHRT